MSKNFFKLSEIADFLGGQLVGDGSKSVSEIKTLFEADKGTIRADFAESLDENAVHGSDSIENAAIEITYFFGEDGVCPRTR